MDSLDLSFVSLVNTGLLRECVSRANVSTLEIGLVPSLDGGVYTSKAFASLVLLLRVRTRLRHVCRDVLSLRDALEGPRRGLPVPLTVVRNLSVHLGPSTDIFTLNDYLIADDTANSLVCRHCVAHTLRVVLERWHAPLEPVRAILTEALLIGLSLLGRAAVVLEQGALVRGGVSKRLCVPVANRLVRADLRSYSRMVDVESSLHATRITHMLLLLLLRKVKLVEACIALLRGEGRHRVCSAEGVPNAGGQVLTIGLLVRLDVVTRDEVEQLAQSFVVLHEVLKDLALLNLF